MLGAIYPGDALSQTAAANESACQDGNVAAVRVCLNEKLQQATDDLFATYDQVTASPRLPARRRAALRREKAGFVAQRNRRCIAAARTQGSIGPELVLDCAISETQARRRQLQALLPEA